ncbi:MAG: hypothetical protein PHQ51_00490, partial [Synergistales bacterium]|nr:hypothetical protein [Synergistales bacterium]
NIAAVRAWGELDAISCNRQWAPLPSASFFPYDFIEKLLFFLLPVASYKNLSESYSLPHGKI